MQRKRGIVVTIALLGAAGACWLYYVVPYRHHEKEAAAYEQTVRADVASVGDVRIVSGGHQMTEGEGNDDILTFRVRLKVSTSVPVDAFEERLRSALGVDAVSRVTALGDRGGRHLLEVEAQLPESIAV